MTSYYELTHPLGKIRPQSFLDTFDGDSLRSWWTETSYNGSLDGTALIVDEVNEGLEITCPATSGTHPRHDIAFNDIREFDHNGCGFIVEFRQVTTTENLSICGLNELGGSSASQDQIDVYVYDSATDVIDKIRFVTSDGVGGSTSVDLQANADQNWHRYQVETDGVLAKCWFDNVLTGIATTGLPNGKLQPKVVSVGRNNNRSRKCRIRYMECFNL